MNIAAADNLLFLVDEMLAYSKDPALLLQKKQEFELNSLIHKVLSLITVPENVLIDLPEGKNNLNFSVIALEQILINLLSNAIRYNDKSSPLIRISFSEHKNFYELTVADNGRGIPVQYLDNIFSRNFTSQIKDRFNTPGSGIGLATVKDLLTLLESSISVESVPGEGSRFLVRLKK